MDKLCEVKVFFFVSVLDGDKALEANGIETPVTIPAVGKSKWVG